MTEPQKGSHLPPAYYCEEKHRLIQEFVEANHVLMTLLSEQTSAVIDEDPDFSRFDDLLHMARERKDHAKYALIAHVDQHHC
jgi:hypothetical protein